MRKPAHLTFSAADGRPPSGPRARVALTIAGSDSGGGAGIQADLKTFAARGVYGCSAITALTAQNTRGVQAIFPVPPGFVAQQIASVFEDLEVDAVKLGMLGETPVIDAVADALTQWQTDNIVLDPVMVAKSGQHLLAADAVGQLRRRLLPSAMLITPNLPEAAVLVGCAEIETREEMPRLAARLQGLGARNVLLKGGHLLGGESPDLLLHGGELIWLEAARIATPHTHGTGCSYSAAITAGLARGVPLPRAVADAKTWLTAAIDAGQRLGVGQGRGPVHHFHEMWQALDTPAVVGAAPGS